MTFHSKFVIPFLVSVLTLSFEAQAGLIGKLLGAGASAAGSSSKHKSYDANTLQPADLKACLIQAHSIDENDAKSDAAKKRIESDSAKIDKDNKALKAEGKKDFTSQAEVDAFNARVKALKTRNGAFNKSVNEWNSGLAARKVSIDTFNTRCAGKKYFTDDLASIKGGLPFNVADYTNKK